MLWTFESSGDMIFTYSHFLYLMIHFTVLFSAVKESHRLSCFNFRGKKLIV